MVSSGQRLGGLRSEETPSEQLDFATVDVRPAKRNHANHKLNPNYHWLCFADFALSVFAVGSSINPANLIQFTIGFVCRTRTGHY
jgi:hypothetical protein